MKINWNKKYTTIAVYALIVIVSAVLITLILSSYDRFRDTIGSYISIINPFIYGFFIAYLVNFPLKILTKWLSKIKFMKKKSVVHMISLVLAYIFVGLLIYLFAAFILPQLIESVTGLAKRTPTYVKEASNFLDKLSWKNHIPAEIVDFLLDRWNDIAKSITEYASNLLPKVFNFLRDLAQQFFNIFIGIIVSVYLLARKDYFIGLVKKVNYGLFKESLSEKLVTIARRSNSIFGNFLGGKILDSLIIGILVFIILLIVKMPYALLVSFIVGVTNIIPFFGPFIGAIPSFFIILFESPVKAFWFLVIILIVQQVDGNIIGPKILGDSLGISSFWILFSVLVSGKVFGFVGMIIGVPLFVLIYSIVKEAMELRLEKKGLPTATEDYVDM